QSRYCTPSQPRPATENENREKPHQPMDLAPTWEALARSTLEKDGGFQRPENATKMCCDVVAMHKNRSPSRTRGLCVPRSNFCYGLRLKRGAKKVVRPRAEQRVIAGRGRGVVGRCHAGAGGSAARWSRCGGNVDHGEV